MYSEDERLRDWIEDIIDNIDSIQTYVAGHDFAMFAGSSLTRDACERCIERIAEAAIRIGADRMAKIAPDTVLHQLRGLGNRLRHEYDRIDECLLWDLIECDLPPLRASCAAALG